MGHLKEAPVRVLSAASDQAERPPRPVCAAQGATLSARRP